MTQFNPHGFDTLHTGATDAGGIGRRRVLQLAGAGAAATAVAVGGTTSAQAHSTADPAWDKVFAPSDLVKHEKVFLTDRVGTRLSADVYVPVDLEPGVKAPALVVGDPYGGVKEHR